VKELQSESVTNRAYIENAMKDLEAQRALMENVVGKLEGTLASLQSFLEKNRL